MQISYAQLMSVLESTDKRDTTFSIREDRLHGALLILLEILRVCNDGELYTNVVITYQFTKRIIT